MRSMSSLFVMLFAVTSLSVFGAEVKKEQPKKEVKQVQKKEAAKK